MSKLDRLMIRALASQQSSAATIAGDTQMSSASSVGGSDAVVPSVSAPPPTTERRIPSDDARPEPGPSVSTRTLGQQQQVQQQPARELYVWNRATSPRLAGQIEAPGEEAVDPAITVIQARARFNTARTIGGLRQVQRSNSAFKPAWEVDAVQWPQACRQLELQMDDELGQLADRILQLADGGSRIVGITGLERGEGRSTLLLSLARQLAWKSPEFAMLDADWRRPALAERLGLSVQAGWQQVLRGTSTLSEVCVRSLRDRFVLVPLLSAIMKPLEASQCQQLRDMLDPLLEVSRLMLVDLGPVGSSAMQLIRCDGLLVVRDVRRTSNASLAQLIEKLQFAGLETWGVIENFLHAEQPSATRSAA